MRKVAFDVAIAVAVLTALTCGEKDEPGGGYQPEAFCPGGPGCPDGGDAKLFAGAAAVKITPAFDANVETLSVDVDGDAEYEPILGDQFEDKNGNGKFDAIWIAGFGTGRPAKGVHDDQWARAIALRQGETTIALVALDCVGYFYDEVEQIRAMVADTGVDYVAISATHSHESRDTLGIWGVTEDTTGIDPPYMDFLRAQVAAAVRQAIAALEPAKVQYGGVRTRDLPGGVIRYQSDVRDPYIVDDEVRVLRLMASGAGAEKTIATLVNWGSHPEYLGDENDQLSSDYPHWLRDGLEKGVDGPNGDRADGLGGVAVFVAGALGSQIGPGDVEPMTWSGDQLPSHSLESGATVGTQIAYYLLKSLADPAKSPVDETASIAFRKQTFFADIENRAYHTAIIKQLFDRDGYNWDDERPLIPGENEPDVKTEIAVIDIGRAQIITVPGELDPALFVGGYDGGYTPQGKPVVDTAKKNPPDLSKAPPPPYLRDLARGDADYVFLFGLTNDMIGYFVPEFDYVLHPTNPYFDEAEGDHYEETNSIGPNGWPRVKSELTKLLGWRREREE